MATNPSYGGSGYRSGRSGASSRYGGSGASQDVGSLLVEAAKPLIQGILKALGGGGGQDNERQIAELNREHARKTEQMQEHMKKENEATKKRLAKIAKENEKREAQHAKRMEKIMQENRHNKEKMEKELQKEQAKAGQERVKMKAKHQKDMRTHTKRQAQARVAKMKAMGKAQERIKNFYPPPPKLTGLLAQLKRDGIRNAIMIACCGSTGVGKSSWINAVTEGENAKTGTAGECTVELAYFPYAPEGTGSGFVFVDCPGGGTPRFPQEMYVREMGLRYYDIVLFFCHSRFSQADLQIMEDCKKNRINYFAVGTKVEQSLERLEKEPANADKSDEERELMLRETLRWYRDVNGVKKEAAALDKIFLSDSDNFELFDTAGLLESIMSMAANGRTPKVQVGRDGSWNFTDKQEAAEHNQLAEIMQNCDVAAADRALLGMAGNAAAGLGAMVGNLLGQAMGGGGRGRRNDEKTNW